MTQFYRHENGSVWFTVRTYKINNKLVFLLTDTTRRKVVRMSDLNKSYERITSLEFFTESSLI